MSYPGIFEAF